MNRFSRAAIGLVLTSSLLDSSLTALAQTTQSKNQTQDNVATKTDQTQSTATTSTARSGKPLATNEDPSMIGKRNINGGSIAKMSGSTEKEVRLGRELATEVDRQAKFIDDPLITEYVNRVGQNIVLHSDAKVPFTIKVIDSDEVNAFALPGGFFYVNKGLILAADNEAELAGVMAHEIAHVAARHAMENEAKMRALDIGMLAGILLGGGIISNVLYNGGSLIEGLAFLKFTRGAEEEADRLGIQYMWAAGYDPHAMVTFFEKLEAKEKKKPGTIAKAFSTHPMTSDRIKEVGNLVARFPDKQEYEISSSQFDSVKSRLISINAAQRPSDVRDGRPTLKRRPTSTSAGG